MFSQRKSCAIQSCAIQKEVTHFIVDDDFRIAPFPPGGVLVEGFAVGKPTGPERPHPVTRHPKPLDLVLLDWTCPIQWCRDLRRAFAPAASPCRGDAHGAKTTSATELKALDSGADDFIKQNHSHRGTASPVRPHAFRTDST